MSSDVPLPTAASVGDVVFPPGFAFGPRTQLNVQLLVVLSGEVRVWVVGDEPRLLVAGSVCALLPGRQERLRAGPEPSRHAFVHGWWADPPPDLTRRLAALPGPCPLSAPLAGLLREALAVQTGHLPTSAQVLQSLVLAMLWRYVGDAEEGSHGLPVAVERGRSFIDAHLREPLTLAAVAAAATVTPEHLIRLFRAHLGTTPMGYAWDRRVTTAIQLLVGTGLPLKVIAAQCGFSTTQHFSRRIRERTGLPPSRVREQRWDATSVDRAPAGPAGGRGGHGDGAGGTRPAGPVAEPR